MKKFLAVTMTAVVLSLGGVSVAAAQDTDSVTQEATNDQGDTGLIGLAGLLGLLGLLGLKRRDDTTNNRTYDRDRAGVR
jgi:LPXTG-motif cell wall-anchored protein